MNPIALKSARCALLGLALLGLATASTAAIPIAHWTQASGAQVYLVESPTIPMVDIQIDFDVGGRRDPKDQPGLANLMAASTAYGVTARATQPALDENGLSDAWADLGASLGGSAGADRLSFALRTLTYPDLLEKATALAARQLGDAAFPEAPWLRDRAKLVASLKEASTRPATLARRAYSRAVYGEHPYGAESTEATLGRISAADMRRLHAQTLKSCHAKVSIVGAVGPAQADALVSRLLAYLPSTGCAALPAVPEVLPLPAAHGFDSHFERLILQVHRLCLLREIAKNLLRLAAKPREGSAHGAARDVAAPGRVAVAIDAGTEPAVVSSVVRRSAVAAVTPV